MYSEKMLSNLNFFRPPSGFLFSIKFPIIGSVRKHFGTAFEWLREIFMSSKFVHPSKKKNLVRNIIKFFLQGILNYDKCVTLLRTTQCNDIISEPKYQVRQKAVSISFEFFSFENRLLPHSALFFLKIRMGRVKFSRSFQFSTF